MATLQVDSPLRILVKANAAKTEIVGWEGNVLKVAVKAPAEKNKANIEIIKFFSKLTKKQVKIISGKTSKRKVLKFS